MTLENTIRMIAGTLVLISLSLGYWINEAWLLLTAFVGLNLLQSSLTKWCFAESVLKKCVFKQQPVKCK